MNNIDLTIIISHYFTSNAKESYKSFIQTLDEIKSQSDGYNIEVIITDDGSDYSKNIVNNYSEKIAIPNDERNLFILKNEPLKKHLKDINIKNNQITKWLYIPKIKPCMSKARLWNYGIQYSNSNNLFFLDDDNYFISKKSISSLLDLFKKYHIIFGQIKDNSGRLRSYKSTRVQGTTFGIKKEILQSIKGFGVWTEKTSCGIDSDLWIKLFNYSKKNDIIACYTNKVSTFDSCSKRWRKYTKLFKDFKVRKEFMSLYGIKNYKNSKHNPSREKSLWIKNLII